MPTREDQRRWFRERTFADLVKIGSLVPTTDHSQIVNVTAWMDWWFDKLYPEAK